MNNIVSKCIDGVLYKAQFKGVAFASNIDTKYRDDKSSVELGDILFSEVLISPEIDDPDEFFEDLDSYTRVRDFLWKVANGTYEKKKGKVFLKKKVEKDWGAWRLVFTDLANFTYDEVFRRMTPQEIEEANIALDIVHAEIKKASKR